MPQPPPSLRTQMFPRSNFHPGVQNVGGVSKMNQRPSRQASLRDRVATFRIQSNCRRRSNSQTKPIHCQMETS
eukprot:1334264-Rhodomonas_salina.1